jgi:hypothetical protein
VRTATGSPPRRWPMGDRDPNLVGVDAVDLDEAMAFPERSRRHVRFVACGGIEGLHFDHRHTFGGELHEAAFDEGSPDACASAGGDDRGERDLRARRKASWSEDEADDLVVFDHDPARMDRYVAPNLIVR